MSGDDSNNDTGVIEMVLYPTDFASVFAKLLKKYGITCYQIYKCSGLDQAYLSRLKNGGKGNPSPEVVTRISLAMARLNNKVKQSDIEQLFNSIGRSIMHIPKIKSNFINQLSSTNQSSSSRLYG